MYQDSNFTGVIPSICVEGAAEAIAFYQRAFGAKELQRIPAEDGRRVMHGHLEINGGGLMLSDPFPEQGYPFQPPAGTILQLVVEDGQAWWDRAVAAGCEVTLPFELAPWGDRFGQLRDPFQMTWAINAPAKPA